MSESGKEVLGRVENEPQFFVFWCEACGYCHHLDATRWRWDGDMVKPTVSPSFLVNKDKLGKDPRCHFFIRSGQLQYLQDCTHSLAGQTVDMTPWEEV